tara:strand:- start:486 stop:1037 length:552 start_codon:yes stop_codon:yes gene_type:complete
MTHFGIDTEITEFETFFPNKKTIDESFLHVLKDIIDTVGTDADGNSIQVSKNRFSAYYVDNTSPESSRGHLKLVLSNEDKGTNASFAGIFHCNSGFNQLISECNFADGETSFSEVSGIYDLAISYQDKEAQAMVVQSIHDWIASQSQELAQQFKAKIVEAFAGNQETNRKIKVKTNRAFKKAA